jgi:hypothetical protein
VSVAGVVVDGGVDDDAARVPVWIALSDLYLDTEVEAFHDAIAETLAASPFDLDELQAMLMHDVHPVLFTNLMAPAGVWEAFDPDWLVARIRARGGRRRRGLSGWFRSDIDAQWTAVAAKIATLRGHTGPA